MTDKLPGAWSDTGHYLFNSTFDGEVSLVSGGTPCEDVSARGLREGPKGLLSCLWQDLLGWVDAVKAPRILWENVLGALGTQCPKRGKGCQCEKDGGEESLLGCLIKELEKREFHWAYRVICSTSFGILRRRRVILLADREDPGWARSVLFGRSQKAAEERQRLGVHTEPAGATPSGEGEYDYYVLDERSRSSAHGPYWRQASRLVPCPTGEKTYLVMRVRGGQRAGGVSREVRKVSVESMAKVFGVGDEKDLKIFNLMRGANKLRDECPKSWPRAGWGSLVRATGRYQRHELREDHFGALVPTTEAERAQTSVEDLWKEGLSGEVTSTALKEVDRWTEMRKRSLEAQKARDPRAALRLQAAAGTETVIWVNGEKHRVIKGCKVTFEVLLCAQDGRTRWTTLEGEETIVFRGRGQPAKDVVFDHKVCENCKFQIQWTGLTPEGMHFFIRHHSFLDDDG
ncbi:hypothetical protein HKI87_08g51620 [Chloropicon roscoffensis]|uniref:DNA (cytosine-5-)-methyltransferase n=1 Tax=Chloropicon roscoffensis TaxID=1461544 RepID=A0AAX4PCJ8_9CHLO